MFFSRTTLKVLLAGCIACTWAKFSGTASDSVPQSSCLHSMTSYSTSRVQRPVTIEQVRVLVWRPRPHCREQEVKLVQSDQTSSAAVATKQYFYCRNRSKTTDEHSYVTGFAVLPSEAGLAQTHSVVASSTVHTHDSATQIDRWKYKAAFIKFRTESRQKCIFTHDLHTWFLRSRLRRRK